MIATHDNVVECDVRNGQLAGVDAVSSPIRTLKLTPGNNARRCETHQKALMSIQARVNILEW